MIAAEYSVSTGAASAAVTAFALSYGALQVVYGPLGDRFGRYATIAVASFVSAFGSLACALAPSLDALVLARLLSGATMGAFIPLSLAWIGDTFAYEKRQAIFAQFMVGQMIGIGLGTALSGWLAEQFGWRAIFVAMALLLLVIAALLGLELKRNPATARATGTPTSIAQSFAKMPGLLVRRRVLIALGFTEGMLVFGALAFVAYHLQQRFGLGPGPAGSLLAAYAAGGLLYAFSAKRAVRGIGEIGLAMLGGVVLAVGYGGLVIAPTALVATLCIGAIGAGFYMFHTTVQTTVTQVEPQERGSAVAVFATFLFMGQASGVWLAARVVDAFGAAPVFAVAALGLLGLSVLLRHLLLLRRRNVA
jgi:predicted MFS family arabinose efflux permease